ncbi:putative T7SS-secreted protein [Streptomyces himalayensis]
MGYRYGATAESASRGPDVKDGGTDMAAQLGTTTDPKELIPGAAESLEEISRSLRKQSGTFEDVGTGLGRVRVPGWTGKASDAFWDKFSGEKRNWLRASDAMSGAASVISGYAGALSNAQQQAREAIALWDSGDRSQAEEILTAARQQVQHEGEAAKKRLAELAGSGSDAPDWLAKASDLAEQKSASGQTALSRTHHASDPLSDQRKWNVGQRSEEPASTPRSQAWTMKLAEATDEAKLWEAGAKGRTMVGSALLSGSAEIKALGLEGTVGTSLSNGTFEAKASGSAYLAKGSAQGSLEYGIIGAKGQASGFVGAEGSAKASVGKDGLHIGGEAFAGAKATVSAGVDVGGIGAGVTAEGWAGAGAAAAVDAGMKDGKFVVGGELGLGLGLGAKVSTQIEIDPDKVVDTAGDAADAVGDGLDAIGDGVKSLNPFG